MKQILEFIPLIVFLIFFKFYDIFVGVAALMIASTVCIIALHVFYKHLEKVALFMYAMVMIFGALTLYSHDKEFFKWKVTFIYAILACVLFFSQLIFKKNIIKEILGKEMELPEMIWARINAAWSLFFIFCAVLNLYVMFNFSDQIWVYFKVFGITGLTLVFTLINGVYIYKHASNEKPNP